MTAMPARLDVPRRVRIIHESDVRCGCGLRPTEQAAHDPAWFIDSILAHNPEDPVHPVEIALVRCPGCW